jgi:hypothetical protein
MIKYCNEDTTALYNLIIAFEQSLNSMGFSLAVGNTISMLAYNGFIIREGQNLLDKNVLLKKSLNPEIIEIINKSFRGGITDVFKNITISASKLDNMEISKLSSIFPEQTFTNKQIAHYDIVSSYPHAMNQELGVGDCYKINLVRNDYLDSNNNFKIGFYKVRVNDLYGLIYNRYKSKLEGLKDNVELYLSSFELNYLLNNDLITLDKVIDGVY